MSTPSPGGTLLGGNQLQQAIDVLTQRVQDLTTAINGLRQSGVTTGGPTSNYRANPAGGGTGTGNAPLFPRPAPPPPPPSGGQLGQTPYGYNPRHAAPPPAPPTPTGNAPTFGSRTLLNQMAGYGPGQANRLSGNAATIGGALGGIYTAIATFGKQQFSNQVGMNAYAQQASLMAPTNMTFGQINQQLYGQAFGGNGNTPWAIANNTMDAAQGQLILNSVAGTWNPSSTQQGRNIMGATGAFGYINPTLGLSGSANMAGQLYNPQTSMMMRALGYPVTPRVLGRPGQTNNAGAVIQGMMRRMYSGRNSISQKQLAANLSPGQTGFIDLQQVFGQNAGAWATTFEAYNRAAQKGMGAQQFGSMLNQAVQNKGNAQQILAQKGILPTSDLQSIKDLGAQKTARASDYSSAYNSALQTSTGLLTQFNKQLSQLLDSSHLNSLLGGAGGATGVLHNLTGFGSMGLGIGSAMALGRGLFGAGGAGGAAGGLLGRIFGGAGAAGSGAAGGGAMAGLGAAVLPASLSLGALFGLSKVTSKGGGSMLSPRKGDLGVGGQWWNDLFGGKGSPGWLTGDMAKMIGMGGGAASQAQTAQSPPNPAKKPVGGSPTGAAVDAVHVAERYLGTPYVYGGSNPSTGFDCSGLVQYAYGQAGVKLPRTSEEQWAYLQKKAVPSKNAREGDIVFMAGSDGTPNNPGHEGLMISNTQLIQAPYTGQDVQIIRYNPNQWSHVARPTGGLTGGGSAGFGGGGSPLATSSSSAIGGVGNAGAGFNSSEMSALQTGGEAAALGGGGGGTLGGSPGTGSSTGGLTLTSQPLPGKGGGGRPGPTTAGLRGNKRIMNQAASKYGWGTGREWAALYSLEMQEAGFNNLAQNPSSTAFGMGQFLDSTWGPYGPKTSNPTLQAKYMMEYIRNRYGDPIRAEQHELANHWYARGTANAYKGVAIVGENGPELISMRGGENIANASQTNSIMNRQQMPTVNITIQKDAIHVHGGGSGTPHDAGNSGREIAKQLLAQLSSENIYAAIGVGHKL